MDCACLALACQRFTNGAACGCTGALRSCQQAFAWQRAVVRFMLSRAAEPAALSEQCCTLADMLSSGSGSRYAPHLHLNTRLVLAVGGYQTSLRSQEGGPAVLVWLQERLEVLAHCSHVALPIHFTVHISKVLGQFYSLKGPAGCIFRVQKCRDLHCIEENVMYM